MCVLQVGDLGSLATFMRRVTIVWPYLCQRSSPRVVCRKNLTEEKQGGPSWPRWYFARTPRVERGLAFPNRQECVNKSTFWEFARSPKKGSVVSLSLRGGAHYIYKRRKAPFLVTHNKCWKKLVPGIIYETSFLKGEAHIIKLFLIKTKWSIIKNYTRDNSEYNYTPKSFYYN